MFAILGILAIAGAVGLVMVADDSSAATMSLYPSGDDYAKVSSSITYKFDYAIDNSTATYKAALVDSDGNATAGTVSPSSGTLYSSSTSTKFTITLPSTAGDYALKVTVTDGETEYVRYAYVKAVEAVTLSATVENTGSAERSFTVYFYLKDGDNWNKIDGSKTDVKVAAGKTQTVTYDYVVKDIEGKTFCIKADDSDMIGGEIKGLGEEHSHTFYTSTNDYRFIEYTCIAVLVILLMVAVWIYRKPVKNFGKPKARK